MVDNQERGYHQLDSCKPTHYSVLVHMALAKTTLSLKSKLRKGSSMFFSLRRRDAPCLRNIRKMKSWAKAKKLELVLSHYQPLTWV
jgi:hypothetical protein